MPPDFNLPFVLSVVGAFLTSSVVAYTYVWPAVRAMPRYDALRLLAAFHAFRFLGMNFLVSGFVSSELSSDFANKIGWGDLIAAVLALLSMAALSWRWSIAVPIVWIFNIWGTLDLLNAYYMGLHGRNENRKSRPLRRGHLYPGALRASAARQSRTCLRDSIAGQISRKNGMTRREDRDPPCVGSDALLAHERAFRTSIQSACVTGNRPLSYRPRVAVGPLLLLRLLTAKP